MPDSIDSLVARPKKHQIHHHIHLDEEGDAVSGERRQTEVLHDEIREVLRRFDPVVDHICRMVGYAEPEDDEAEAPPPPPFETLPLQRRISVLRADVRALHNFASRLEAVRDELDRV